MRPEDAITAPAADGDTSAGPTAPSVGLGDRDGDGGGERYELIERLGEGAMGVVWAARDRVLDRTVALKFLHDRFLGADHQERLTAEARAMARLSHPNVVGLYDVGERDGRVYLTMELVRGETVKDWLATPRPWREVVAAFRAAARGLAAAHDAGVIHRDIKPSNILRGADGVVRVADFGVAHAGSPRLVAGSVDGPAAAATATAGVIGTPAYMSPERLLGEPADAAGDQFAFFVALYEGLAGRRPFIAATADELRALVAGGAAPPPGVPRWLARAVLRGLAADPAARFPSMSDVVVALGGPRRRGAWLALAGLLVAGGAAALAVGPELGRDRAAPACDVGHELDGVWDAAARRRGAAAFAGLGLDWAPAAWTQLERGLDRYATRWLAARARVCRAGGDAAETARRQRCLDDRRTALAGMVGSLAAPDRALAERASRLVLGLPAVEACERAAYVAGSSADRAAALQAREDLAAARIAGLTGRDLDAISRADRAVAGARTAGDRWVEADALSARGMAELNIGRHADAVTTLDASVELAGAAGARELQFDARLRLAQALDRMGRFKQAHAVLDLAEAALAELPEMPARRGFLLTVRARVLQVEGRNEEARAAFERALPILTTADGVDTESVAVAHANLAGLLNTLGRNDESLTHYRRVLELRAPLGEQHPMTAKTHGEMANVLADLGRNDEAFAAYQRAIDVLRRAPGKEVELIQAENNYASALGYAGKLADAIAHFRTALELSERVAPGTLNTVLIKANLAGHLAMVGDGEESVRLLREALATLTGMPGAREDHIATFRANLGVVLGELGREQEAAAELAAARAAYERIYGPAHPTLAQVLINEARGDRRRKRYRELRARAERALAIREQALPAEHPDRGEALYFVALGRLHTGDAAGAVAAAEQALANLRAADADTDDATWVLAQALWKSGRDRPRAVTLAREARAAMAAATPPDAELAAVDAWLARAGAR